MFKNQQLEHILCIKYPFKFKKGQTKIQVLIDFGIKFNIMNLAYAVVFRPHICPTNIKDYKIDRSTLSTYDMALANFQFQNKQKKMHFFLKNFSSDQYNYKSSIKRIFFGLQ